MRKSTIIGILLSHLPSSFCSSHNLKRSAIAFFSTSGYNKINSSLLKSSSSNFEEYEDNNITNLKQGKMKVKTESILSSASSPLKVMSTNGKINMDNDTSSIKEKKSLVSSKSFLYTWATHSDASYHEFTRKEALAIRKELVLWYRSNRRKLPWRGDLPPYDGSTAGYSKSKNDGKKKNANSIVNYFKVKESIDKQNQMQTKVKDIIKGENQKNKKCDNNDDSISVQNSTCAYGVWVSEIMLQQTRVEAVIPYYIKWMKSFPTINSLANATEEEVNSHWAGLGFYRRARFLHTGAKQVMEQFNGTLPSTVKELLTISGIGPYTAAAIASIAYNVSVPLVDGNVCRVLARVKGIANHIKAPVLKDDIGWKLANQIVNAGDISHFDDNDSPMYELERNVVDNDEYGSPGEVNQALMELGATYCAPSGSGMDDMDPLKEFYTSTQISKCIANIILKEKNMEGMIDMIEETAKLREKKAEKGHKCQLCDPNGIQTVLEQILNELQDGNFLWKDQYQIGSIGHSAIPISPPKKSKREEVLIIAALCDIGERKGRENRWLMMQRPSKGLLAGQWEFPAICAWSSIDDDKIKKDKKMKRKNTKLTKNAVDIPHIEGRKRNEILTDFLENVIFSPSSHIDIDKNDVIRGEKEIMNDEKKAMMQSLSSLPRTDVGNDSLEHIFSHVRHTMWVQHNSFCYPSHLPSSWKVLLSSINDVKNEQIVRWMTEKDMKTVGITSGVKKILTAVKKQNDGSKIKKRKL